MKQSFRIGGAEIVWSYGFFLVLALFLLLDRQGIASAFLLAVALHEGMHLALLYLAGDGLRELSSLPAGVRIRRRGRRLLSYGWEAAVYLAGPAGNLAAAFFCRQFFPQAQVFYQINLFLGFFNLLPISSLDGGQLCYLLLCRVCSPDRARSVHLALSFLLLTPLATLGIFYLLGSRNISLLVTACYLAILLVKRQEF